MISKDRLQVLVATLAGAALGIVTGYSLRHEWFGILIWALIGAVVLSSAVYCYRVFVDLNALPSSGKDQRSN